MRARLRAPGSPALRGGLEISERRVGCAREARARSRRASGLDRSRSTPRSARYAGLKRRFARALPFPAAHGAAREARGSRGRPSLPDGVYGARRDRKVGVKGETAHDPDHHFCAVGEFRGRPSRMKRPKL